MPKLVYFFFYRSTSRELFVRDSVLWLAAASLSSRLLGPSPSRDVYESLDFVFNKRLSLLPFSRSFIARSLDLNITVSYDLILLSYFDVLPISLTVDLDRCFAGQPMHLEISKVISI